MTIDPILLKIVSHHVGTSIAPQVFAKVEQVDIVICFIELGAEIRFRYGADNNFISNIEKLEKRIEVWWSPSILTLEIRIHVN